MQAYVIIGIIVLAIGGGILFKYNQMSNQIEDLESMLALEISKGNEKSVQLGLANANYNAVKLALDDVNQQLKDITLDKEQVEKELKDFQNLPLSERITSKELKELLAKDDNFKKTCEYGLELNRRISGLKYEDF